MAPRDAILARYVIAVRRLMAALLAWTLLPGPAAASIGEVLRRHGDVAFAPAGRDTEFPVVIVPRTFAVDGAGFLWAGGAGGLFRWDGYAVVQYLAGSRHPDGLPDHEISVLHRDAAGRLWVGTKGGGVARYDASADRFVPVPLTAGRAGAPAIQAALEIDDIADDGAGGLLVATADGLYRRAARDGVPVPRLAGAAGRIRTVLRDRDGRIWIGGAFGLEVAPRGAAPGASRFSAVPLGADATAAPPLVTRLVQDATGAIWIGSHDGAFVLPRGAGRPVPVALAGNALSAHEVMAMAEIRPGEVWIGTYGDGIVAARADGSRRHIAFDAHASKGLDSNVIFGLFRDRSGIGWVSTPFGISHADLAAGDAIVPLFNHPGAEASLAVEQPTALLARARGDLWIGSEENGIEILDAAGRVAGHVPVQPVVALAEAPDGRVFAGGRGGAYVIDADGHAATRLEIPGRAATDTVWALCTIGDELWLGGDSDGVWVLRAPAAGGVTVMRHITAPVGLTGRVAAIRAMPDGTVAVATSGGLWLVAPGSGGVRVVGAEARPDGLPSNHLGSLGLDGAGRLWVGSMDAGVAVLTGWSGGAARFARVGIEDGIGNPDIDAMLPDGRGRMWVATDSGLVTIDTASLAVAPLGAADGVAVAGYWTGSYTATADGDMLFGGTGGLTVVRPDLPRPLHASAPVAITRLVAGGELIASRNATRITLRPGARSLSAEFAVLDFADPRRNRYRYRLEGFDRDWIETDAGHRVAAYTNLRPGNYVLALGGSDHAGTWSTETVRIAVRVPPAWDETIAFRLGIVLVAFGAFGVLLQLRTRLLRLHQRTLEREVAERTAALRESQVMLERLAHLDALTSLPNRRALNNRMAQACRDRFASFALAIVDIDGFKPVNDDLGHDAGDRLLVVIAERLRGCVRASDFVARWGGDEFAILIASGSDADAIEEICERVVRAASEPVAIGERHVRVGASVGVALCPVHGADPDALTKSADLALYAAKRAGRGTWRWFVRPLAERV